MRSDKDQRRAASNVIGIDDWEWLRNHSYGTIVCDLERRRPVTLLPDREQATTAAWLAQHQEITVIARDPGGGYSEAAARALPHAVQVADRWHLMENASRAFLDAVRKSMRQTRAAIGATTIDSCACRKLNPHILVMQSPQDWTAEYATSDLDSARDRRILVQGQVRARLVVVIERRPQQMREVPLAK